MVGSPTISNIFFSYGNGDFLQWRVKGFVLQGIAGSMATGEQGCI